MKIKRIHMKNFGPYFGTHVAHLDVDPDGLRRVVAVGGLNGAGKTSLKDAIAFGLLGFDDAMLWIYRLERKGDQKREIEQRASNLLNRRALKEGETSASVRLVLEDQGRTVEVCRCWEFSRDGRFRSETLEGSINGQRDFSAERFKDFLRNTIPPETVPLFIFDGEQIQAIANEDPGPLVRQGIDTILGLHLCDALDADMSKLQDQYRTKAAVHSELEAELADLEAKQKKLSSELARLEDEQQEVEDDLDQLRARSEVLAGELSEVLGTSAGTNPKELQQQLERTRDEIGTLRESLGNAVERWIIPALPGGRVQSLLQQIDGEDARARWEEGKSKVQPQREKLIARLFDNAAPQPTPPLVFSQTEFLRERVRHEWDALFHPPPAGIAAEVRHGNLEPGERAQVRNKCRQALQGHTTDIPVVLTQLDALERRARDLRVSFEKISDRERADEIVKEQKEVERKRSDLEHRWGDNKRQLESNRDQLATLRRDVTKKQDSLVASSKFGERMRFARKVRKAMQLYKDALRPRKRNEVQEHLSYMYAQLARKVDVIQRIELDEKKYEPRLLNKRGDRIPLGGQSAGEKEIYALSLLWALSKSSGRDLPVVIDTPLARLDSDHRENIVTRYLPEAGSQVIVLSTDTEIDRENFEAINRHVARGLRLEFDEETEGTVVREGYFDFDR